MINIGQYNELEVLKKTKIGLYLGDGNDEILLPQRYVDPNSEVGDTLKVFIHLDNENRPVATTETPYAVVGEFAYLRAKDVNEHGAFLDWGISKDVFVPYSEQRSEMKAGNEYLVYIFIDDRSGRIAATSKWKPFLETEISDIENGEEVELIIAEQTDLGYKAIINHKYEGLLYKNEVFENLQPGEIKRGFVKQIRDDGKIDLSLQQQGYTHITDLKLVLLHLLKENKGVLQLGDKSSPEDIYEKLKISKKAFKKTVGGLFKERAISVSDYEIRLLNTDNKK
jgi:predicted RNA-binding protein (virulence factor B family)